MFVSIQLNAYLFEYAGSVHLLRGPLLLQVPYLSQSLPVSDLKLPSLSIKPPSYTFEIVILSIGISIKSLIESFVFVARQCDVIIR